LLIHKTAEININSTQTSASYEKHLIKTTAAASNVSKQRQA